MTGADGANLAGFEPSDHAGGAAMRCLFCGAAVNADDAVIVADRGYDAVVCREPTCLGYLDRAAELLSHWAKHHADLLYRCERQGWPTEFIVPAFEVFAYLSATGPPRA